MSQRKSSWVWRAPWTALGGFGLVSLSNGAGVIGLDSAIQSWIIIWNSITHPIWEVVFWPLREFFGVEIPDLLRDYLSVGVITSTSLLREINDGIKRGKVQKTDRWWAALCMVLWPGFLPSGIYTFLSNRYNGSKSGEAVIFVETLGWFVAIIAVNYMLLFNDCGVSRFVDFYSPNCG